MAESSDSDKPRPLGLLSRIGAALAWPRSAMSNAWREEVSGTTGTDAALLVVLAFAVLQTESLVAALWTAVSGDVGGGLVSLATAITHSAISDLVALAVLGTLVFLAPGPRSLGRDFDLGCVAYVPIAMIAMLGHLLAQALGPVPPWLGYGLTYGSYLWAAALVIVAVAHKRRGFPVAPATTKMVAVGGAALAIALGSLSLSGVEIIKHPERVRPVVAGDLAPSFSLPSIDDRGKLAATFALEDYRGRVVVLDFWATWCGPCREAMPVLEKLHKGYRDRGVVVVSVNTEGADTAGAARRMARRLGLTNLQLSDDGRVSSRFKVTTIPHMVVIDREGMVRHVHRGFSTAIGLEAELKDAIEELL